MDSWTKRLVLHIDGSTCQFSLPLITRIMFKLHRMTLSFVDFNGIVPEKFDGVELSHMVDAE